MRTDELSPALIEKAKACNSYKERMAFIRDNEIELTDEQMEALSGGGDGNSGDAYRCSECAGGKMEETGKTKPGKIFGDLWPDVERKCNKCGHTEWYNF